MSVTLNLTSRWTPAAATDPSVYELTLSNDGSAPIEDFALGFSGPVTIDAHAQIEGATLKSRLSNHTLLAPLAGFVLKPGESWTIVIRGLAPGLRHWSDGAASAYVELAGGTLVSVSTPPAELTQSSTLARKGSARFELPPELPATVSIIPWPQTVAVSGARITPKGLDLRAEDGPGRAAAASFTNLVGDLFPTESLVLTSVEGGVPVRLVQRNGLGAEAYAIALSEAEIVVTATTQTGFLYGLITLGQILRGAGEHPGRLVFPASGTISDAPALGWRGTHLDVARHFYSVDDVARLIQLIAWNKMNRLHLHLSDDEAWRVEIDAYPELTRLGARRGHGMAVPPLLGSGPEPTGGSYSKAEIRKLVALGQSLGVEIVPEIDIPGHCYAVLQALPQLRDPRETGEYQSVQGFPNNCLNPARDGVYALLDTVIDEMLDLFPSGIFHLGADEVPLAAWSGSPEALALLERLAGRDAADKHRALINTTPDHSEADAIEGSGTAILQAHFIGRVHRHITSRGARTGGWEEAAHGDVLDKAKSYLVGWRNVEVNAALAGQGYDIVVSPAQRYYLDMANGPDWSEPGAAWAGWSGPEETYRFEPREGWSEEQLKHLLGVQTCIWSERMTDPAIFDRLVFPRISAVAETGWTLPEHKSWERFRAFSGLMPNMYGEWASQ